jgi:hypothetical protein
VDVTEWEQCSIPTGSKARSAEAIVTFDADGQHKAGDVASLVDASTVPM